MSNMLQTDIGTAIESLFDREKYLRKYPDVQILGMDPLEHYLHIGRYLGRSPGFDLSGVEGIGFSPSAVVPFSSFGTIRHNPLISILVVSYNSGRDLHILFDSIAAQTYMNYEVILIENGDENTEPLLQNFFKNAQYHKTDNVGFAEGNNIALQMSKGELVVLVNPDTRLSPDMLQELLECLRFDESAAVAVPKIYFFERFIQLRIRANAPFSIERERILNGLEYRKLFVCSGVDEENMLRSNNEGLLALNLPYERPRIASAVLYGDSSLSLCETQIGFAPVERKIQKPSSTFEVNISFDAENCVSARYLVNNAGSALNEDGMPFDRGFGQFDDGSYYSKAYVQALCGCAALIRRSAILDRKLFFGPMFAYYEDSELSYSLGKQGYRILYQPASEVFHRHSESTDERSLSWSVLVNRSKQLYTAVTEDEDADLRSFSVNYPDQFSGPLREKLETLDERIRIAGNFKALMRSPRRTVCIYNSYFSSMGGGEKHALDLAELLSIDSDVYLASEIDFDVSKLESYFDVNLKRVRKIICNNIDTHFTSKFEVFVNSTFLSDLIPAAEENLYIVSFPQREVSRQFIKSYRFLHNSPFTQKWADKYWGAHRSATVLPIIGQNKPSVSAGLMAKNRVILSVGRFTYEGHCKNHHLIAAAFREVISERKISSDWCLELVGSCDFSQLSALKYYDDLLTSSFGYNISVLANVERSDLDKAYANAAIYVHATGLGIGADRPECHEHFGITAFEAMANGCLPVVYHLGGPAEQILGLHQAKTFEDFDGLKNAIVAAVETFEAEPNCSSAAHFHAAAIQENNKTTLCEIMESILGYNRSGNAPSKERE